MTQINARARGAQQAAVPKETQSLSCHYQENLRELLNFLTWTQSVGHHNSATHPFLPPALLIDTPDPKTSLGLHARLHAPGQQHPALSEAPPPSQRDSPSS